MRKPLTTGIVVATLVAALAGTAAYAGTPGVDWQPCPGVAGVDCGSVTVPIDWSNPGQGTIHVALARRKATDPAARIGSILMDPGGPGGSGTKAVKAGWTLSPEVTRRFDTVGFDPRGVGDSNPVQCGKAESDAQYPELPRNTEDFRRLTEHNRLLGESCARLTGPLAGFVDTKSVVRDMDAIRAALGERRLTYYGVSYGTLMGQQYAETFPGHVRAMALDSNMDHSVANTAEFLRSQSEAVQETFDQFVAWCDRTPSCALHGQDVRAVLAEVYARADRGELTDPSSHRNITPLELLHKITRDFYGPAWTNVANGLASLRDPAAARAASAPAEDTVPSAFLSVFCADWRVPVHSFAELDGYRRAQQSVAPDMKLSQLAWSAVTGCAGWPGELRDPPHRLSIHNGPPLLMLGGRYDPATPYAWSEAAAAQSGAVLLTYDGSGHEAYFKHSDCVVKATDDYLITGRTPPRGTHCAAVEPTLAQVTAGPGIPHTRTLGTR
ncbi:alpha/beta hydrolase [Amycolatopsis sp. H20-H5]|uniref:alpha/beta hydrolase n=1 Tax=Amycolatopsis sp. H20-H5 TaxID=3046309 RepID=UPI002DBE1C3E|nr:alpha/beta hydrolase [Amycolatopsis sp. H20-H5]MEC3981610.1 alpha/beta hydrolase [Amycolatopsis sp. H20-H5]